MVFGGLYERRDDKRQEEEGDYQTVYLQPLFASFSNHLVSHSELRSEVADTL